jgi:transcriptional regulator with XRE-family HTH domain
VLDADKKIAEGSIAQAIVSLRESLNKTQSVISKELGVTQSRLAQWERDTYKPPPKILLMLAEMAPESKKQWWRDQASARADIDLDGAVVPHLPLSQKEKVETNPELLALIFEAVEAAMNRSGGFFSTKIRAEIIAKVYDEWHLTGTQDCSLVEKLVSRARGPSNRKVSA